MGKARTKSVITEQPTNWIDLHHKKMITMVNSLKVGSIISKLKVNTAHYYKVIKIIDGCTAPVVARQSKTLVLDYIGDCNSIKANCKIYYHGDILPYAQMITNEGSAIK